MPESAPRQWLTPASVKGAAFLVRSFGTPVRVTVEAFPSDVVSYLEAEGRGPLEAPTGGPPGDETK